MKKYSSSLLFLIGVFSVTQVHFFGSIGISELFMFVVAPILFLKNYRLIKSDGFLPILALAMACCVGGIIGGIVNDTHVILLIKGLATPYSIFALVVVYYVLLRDNIDGFKWLMIGIFLSHIIHVFIFQPETFTVQNGDLVVGDEAVGAVVGYALFWAVRIGMLVYLPIQCWYFKTPILYSLVMPILLGAYTIVNSDSSGRARTLAICMSVLLILLGSKSRRKMRRVGKYVYVYALLGVLVVLLFKSAYQYSAMSGVLGEKAYLKYQQQTERGSGVLDLLIAGRQGFFTGIMACIDSPVIGLGPFPADTHGYYQDFLYKYGTEIEYRNFLSWTSRYGAANFYIPSHSYIVSFWMYYGIAGVILWVYALWLCLSYYRRWSCAIPQWYGYFCLATPTVLWNIFFSPYGDRVITALFFTCLLLVKAAYERKIALPFVWEYEARKYDK